MDGGGEVAVGGNGEGEPEVVVGAFAGVVVAYAGVAVDEQGAGVQIGVVVGKGDQGGLVSQPAGVEDGADLAHHVLAFEFGQPLQDFRFGDADGGGDFPVGFRDHGEVALHEVEQLAVGKVHGFGRHFAPPFEAAAAGAVGPPAAAPQSVVNREL